MNKTGLKRRSIRLRNFDYSKEGVYFITICTKIPDYPLGTVKNNKVNLSETGKIAKEYWIQIPKHYKNMQLDEFVVMPNHIHGIIILKDKINDSNVGIQYIEPLPKAHKYQKIIPKSIGSIVRTYKGAVTRWCRKNGFNEFKWQRNFYEHLVRDKNDLFAIRNYIRYNPEKWFWDKENPVNFIN